MRARKASDSDGPRMRSSEVLLTSATLSVLLSKRRGRRVLTTWEGFSSSVLKNQNRFFMSKTYVSHRVYQQKDLDLHNEISNEANQWQKDVFKRRGQRQGLTTQCAQMSCLDGTDVALWWNGIIGKCIALRTRRHQTTRYYWTVINQMHYAFLRSPSEGD